LRARRRSPVTQIAASEEQMDRRTHTVANRRLPGLSLSLRGCRTMGNA